MFLKMDCKDRVPAQKNQWELKNDLKTPKNAVSGPVVG
jgi:hypothetical protein